jgi:predicted nucleic acid-binding protein
MRRLLLDTGPLAAYLHKRPAAYELIDPWVAKREAATTTLNYAEVIEYLRPLRDFRRRRARLRHLMKVVYPFTISLVAGEHNADIRLSWRSAGIGFIGQLDTLIAAVALERGLTVVTTDSDFACVPGLNVSVVSFEQ